MSSENRTSHKAYSAVCRFIIKLGTAAHGYGVSSYRLQSYLARLTLTLGFKGEFMVTPAYINFIFWQQAEAKQHSHFARMSAPGYNMAKLARIDELVNQVAAGTLSVAEGTTLLEEIRKQPPQYGPWPVALGYVLSGAGFAVLLSAAWRDVFLAGALNLVVYAIVLLAGRSKWVANTLEMTSALVASVLANVIAILYPGSDPFIVTLCALIILIPGLPLTLGLAALSAKHVISGMSRLIDGVMITLKLFLGAAVGEVIVNALWTVPAAVVPADIPPGWVWMFVSLLLVALGIVFQIRHKDLGWIVLGGLLAYAGIMVGSKAGFWQGSFLGALVLGVFANLFAWRLRRSTSIVMLAAIMVLVPGAAAYRGLNALQTSGVVIGLTAEWQVLVNIGAIIAGLLVAYTLVPPKATL